ncbi:hypothetical protein O1611_g10400 [Lasiodiplodia mahajangana]|uniref:Uncharacterized protein n=1 Tax=Lasiodiplodia mahajangana TaxID=1108764 RepID=A0ACC2IYK6_9PEZI|nr:hypothetical protein O1611_g10400 [Lasiodiplodia mahajangana]
MQQKESVNPVPMYHAKTITAPAMRASFFLSQNRAPSPLFPSNLCRGLDLGKGLADLVSLLLLGTEELEALEVGKGFSTFRPLAALGPLAVLPLLIDLGLLPESL